MATQEFDHPETSVKVGSESPTTIYFAGRQTSSRNCWQRHRLIIDILGRSPTLPKWAHHWDQEPPKPPAGSPRSHSRRWGEVKLRRADRQSSASLPAPRMPR